MTKTEIEIYNKLAAEFPAEAYSEDTSRGFALTSLKAQYAKERLNNVFGITGWQMVGEYSILDDKSILYVGNLIIKFLDKDNPKADNNGMVTHMVETVGHSAAKKNLGDSYKGAATDALSKGSSNLGLGNEMFKGNINLSTVKEGAKAQKSATNVAPKSSKSNGSAMSDWAGVTKEEVRPSAGNEWS
jgi:hypothetical protein